MSKGNTLKPCGYFVLVETEKVERTTPSGLIIATSTEHKREQSGHCVGIVKAFGPKAFVDLNGCNGPEDWGVAIGDKIEYNRYDGKVPATDGFEQHRLIRDTDVWSVIEEAK